MTAAPQPVRPGPRGARLLDDLYLVSWMGLGGEEMNCHVYVLRGDGGLVMIDCGTPQ